MQFAHGICLWFKSTRDELSIWSSELGELYTYLQKIFAQAPKQNIVLLGGDLNMKIEPITFRLLE